MAKIDVVCVHCHSDQIVKAGRTPQDRQRYHCRSQGCGKFFLLDYKNLAYLPSIKKRIVDMALNGSGIRDTARVLSVNMNTVMSTLKKNLAN